ncbi:YibE/F family protein [Actinokineospora cianjurensis]|uniref:Putative membrane protein n=1 Tax=Actinokineospora cianjurensis TaxID=585224 RepID=A0A421BCN2_9PSEU|nr:YibE/F family protein [Actinokineospora cianjurensis]RLK62070.1 putative membrane protein [Actinokineospora cianjurensis]
MQDWETQPIPRVTEAELTKRGDVDHGDRDKSAARHRRSSGPDTGRRRAEHREPEHSEPEHAKTGHGHGHHGPATPASPRVRKFLLALLAPFALAALVGMVLLYPAGDGPETRGQQAVSGTVTATEASPCSSGDTSSDQCLTVTVEMTDGTAKGSDIRTTVPIEPSTPRFAVGDDVVLAYNGGDALSGGSYQLVDFQRGLPLGVLAALFAIAVLVLGRWQGLKALAALGLSFAVLLLFVLPAILAGENPLLVAIAGAGVIMFAVLYLTHGLSARTSTAVLGTMVSLGLIGVLSAVFSAATNLTGLDDQTTTLLGTLGHGIDTRGLLLAGIVIGALGVLDDVTVTQTSAVWELRAANPALGWHELYAAGLRIGRDHVSSAVNTLVMAYAGAALPVLLYSSLSGVGLGTVLESQTIAQEIVRTLVGSIGLVAAVPVTTAVAALVAVREPALSPATPRTG